MWVADLTDAKVYAYNMETKERDPDKDFNTLEAAGNVAPEGIWSDGITLWVADEDDDKLYSYNLSRDEALDLKFLNVDDEPPDDEDDNNIAGFDPDITEYEHKEPSLLYARIRALTKDPDAHLSYDRPNVLGTDPPYYTALNEGENVLNITVTADGNPTYKQYTLTLPTIDDVPNEWGTTSWVIPAPQGARAPRTRGAISEAGDIDWINVVMEPDQLYEVVLKGAAYGNSDRTLTMPFLGGIVSAENLFGGQDPDTGATLPRILTHTSYEDTWDIGTRSVSGLDGWARTLFRHSEGEGAPQVFQVVVAGAFPEHVGTYDVQVREVEDDHYPNDHTAAVDITLGTPVEGRIDYRFDQDWFRTPPLIDGRYIIEARHGERCYWVDVHDRDGEYINLGSRNCRFVFDQRASITHHYLKVDGLSPETRGPYKLYIYKPLPLSGNRHVGGTLSVDPADVFDHDGVTNATRNNSWTYQWYYALSTGDRPIPGATGSEYTLTDAEGRNSIRARVCYRDDRNRGRRECVYSEATTRIFRNVPVPTTWPFLPAGLTVGDEFRLLFVTKNTRSATLNRMEEYDAWVRRQARADNPVLAPATLTVTRVSPFHAVGSTSTVSARDNTGTNYSEDDPGVPIYWLGGQKAADDYADFWDGSWDHRNPGTLSDGSSITFTNSHTIWTGTNSSGYEKTVTNDDATTHYGLGNTSVTAGRPSSSGAGQMLDRTNSSASGQKRMYGISFVYRVVEGTANQQGNQPATGLPAIGGDHNVGDTVTADVTGIADEDGLTNVVYSYQWLSGDSELTGETNASYTLAGTDFGQTVAVRVTFGDDAGNEETLTSEGIYPVMTARENTPAAGMPTISGTPQVGQTLTADTSGVIDADGLDDVSYAYSWSAGDDEISGVTGNTYTLTAAEQGKAITVTVTFTDDAGNEEAITSAATAAVAPAPLTASIHDAPESHDGENSFTFELRFSETPEPDFSYETLRDQALTASGGTVTNALRLDPPGNVRWEITVEPSSDADVTIVLPVTTDCADQGAICTAEGRMLSAEAALTVAGPTELPPAPEDLTHTVNDDGHVVLSWTAPDDDHITGYRIMRRMPRQGENTLLAYEPDTGTTDTTYTDEDVVAGELYVYRVKAINAAGVGPHSNYVNAEW